jgi:hypothetical protein
LLGEQPFNPLVGSFGWPTLDSRMFIPPWYQPFVVQLISEPATKLPYMKLQYPTYVKDINPDAHIRVKLIVNQWRLTSSTCLVLFSGIIFLNGVKTTFKTIQTAFLKSWNNHFASD